MVMMVAMRSLMISSFVGVVIDILQRIIVAMVVSVTMIMHFSMLLGVFMVVITFEMSIGQLVVLYRVSSALEQ